MRVRALEIDASRHVRHATHQPPSVWLEKNCYVDVCIELLHALGREPLAMLGGTIAIDFEGDQWSFYKPSHDDLQRLYGVEVGEMTCWRPLLDHAIEQLGAGKLIATEADAWWLPDTSGTDYRRNHVKTTIVIADVDTEARRLGYFHNAGYFELDGEDFENTFRTRDEPGALPLYAELVRIDRLRDADAATLAMQAAGMLVRHVARMPATNPVARFTARFSRELPDLQARGLEHYHAWAFATLRQLGSSAELAAMHLRWLHGHAADAHAGMHLATAADAFEILSTGAQAFILKAARAVNAKRTPDTEALFATWIDAWQHAHDALATWAASPPTSPTTP